MARKKIIDPDKTVEPNKQAEYEEFIRFTAFPESLRDKEFGFHTDLAFSKCHNVSRETLNQWASTQGFWDQVNQLWRNWGKKKTPNVIMNLYRKAVREGSAAEVKLWMQIMEDFKERGETEVVMQKKTLQAIQDSTRALIAQEKVPKKK